MLKRLFPLFLSIVMVLSCVPLQAIATEVTEETTEATEVTVAEETEETAADPEADSTLTVAEAIALGTSKDHNTYTEGKYYVSGVISSVYNTTYGNMKIADADGNILTVYGTRSEDGTVRYDAMEVKPVAGDTVTVYGIVGQYNGTAQIKNGWVTEHTVAEPEETEPEETEPTVADPEADTQLSIVDAAALGASKEHNTYTAGKYYVTGVITEVKNTTYGNMYIADENGNSLYIYGLYMPQSEVRYDAMDIKPVAGDTVTVYGVIGQYNGTAQMKNAWLTEHTVAEPEESIIASGTCGENAVWTLEEDGTLIISGTGEMEDYVFMPVANKAPWYSYEEQITSVIIEEGITRVGEHSFITAYNVSSLSLPDSLTEIGFMAFTGMRNVPEVELPQNLVSIGGSAFAGCDSLTSITIPASVTEIGDNIFRGCDVLTEIKVEEENPVYVVQDGVLMDSVQKILVCYPSAKPDTSYAVPEGIEVIGQYAFYWASNLEEILLPDSLREIVNSAFMGGGVISKLSTLTIPENVEKISFHAFNGCYALTELIFEGGAPEFDEDAFVGITTSIYYPADNETWTEEIRQDYGGTITWVPYTAEESEEPEENIIASGTCGEQSIAWTLFETGVLHFSGEGQIGSYYPANGEKPDWFAYADQITEICIEDGINIIGAWAFADLANVKTVTLPETLHTILERAFVGCDSLEEFVVSSVENIETFSYIHTVDGVVYFDGIDGSKYVIAYPNCKKDQTYEVAELVNGIQWSAFDNSQYLTEIILPYSVSYIGGCSFMDSALETITIPAGVSTVDRETFSNCEKLNTVYFRGNAPQMYESTFTGVTANVYYPAGNETWTEEVLTNYGGNLTWIPYEVELKESVASGQCGENAFWNLSESGVLTVSGSGEITECTWTRYNWVIQRVVFETGITEIPERPFGFFNHSVKEVYIADTVKQIGNYAFGNLRALAVVIFAGDAPEIGENCFSGTTFTAYYPANYNTWTEEIRQDYGGTITWVPYTTGGYTVELPSVTATSVFVDGIEYPAEQTETGIWVELEDGNAKTLVICTYNDPAAEDPHTQYPTSMKVWLLSYDNGYTATYVPEFDNLLQYSGVSIRVTGNKGIRMITSIDQETRRTLIDSSIAGYHLVEYGTAVAWASNLEKGYDFVLGSLATMSNYAYKRDVADPIFKQTSDLVQYTNVLVGFNDDQCIPDLVMRSYAILENAEGEQITIYGGQIQRSIGYIAYQNRNAFDPDTDAYEYVWNIIHHVYGNIYDAEYKPSWSQPVM